MRETDNDPSASTASFRAFAQRADDVPGTAYVVQPDDHHRGHRVCALIVIGVLVALL